MPQYNSTDKRTQTIGIEGFTESDIVLEVIGNTTFAGNVSLGDDDRLRLGDGNDLEIYHDSTFGNSIIKESGSGNLLFGGDNILFRDSALSELHARFITNGSVELYYDNVEKFETTATGVTVTGIVVADGVDLGDDERLRFGDAQDLQIYHDSTFNNGVIQETGSGNLLLGGQNIDFRDANLGDSYALFRDDSVNTSVELYYNNTKKFETTTTGVTVTGIVVADGVDVGDDEKIRLGDAQELQIYHDGTSNQSIIEESGTGNLTIIGSNINFGNTQQTASYATFNDGGSVQLFNNGSVKLQTSSSGATTTGIHVADGFRAGDGEEVELGDAQDFRLYHDGTDSYIDNNVGDIHIQALRTEESIIASPNAGVSLYFDNSITFETTATGATLTGTLIADGISLGDNEEIRLGDGNDLGIWHNGSNSIINDEGDGDLYLGGNSSVNITNAALNEFKAKFITDGAVELYYDNVKKFETTTTGATLTGVLVADGVDVGDSERIRLGDAQDLQIYHDTTNSIIDTATGNLILSSANAIDIYNSAITEVRARFLNNGGVELYYDNTKRLETTNTGAKVTGTLDVDGLTLGDDEKIQLGNLPDFEIYHTAANGSYIADIGNGPLKVSSDNVQIKNAADSELLATFTESGSVELYDQNAKKFETTGTGADVTGTLRASTSLVTTTDGSGITITNNAIQGPATLTIDPAAVGNNTGTVVIAGDLQVDGTTTTINSTTVTIDDLNLTLASDVTTQAATNGAGITLGPSGANATWTYLSASDTLNHNKRTRISGSSGITDLAQTVLVQDTTASAADVGGTIGFTGNESAGEATLSLIKGGYVSDGNGYLEFYTNQTDTLTPNGRFTETGSFIVSETLTTTTYKVHIDDNKNDALGLLVTGGAGSGPIIKARGDVASVSGEVDLFTPDSNPAIRFSEIGGLNEQFTVGVNQNVNIGTSEDPEIISRFEVCDFSKLGTNQRIVITSAGDIGISTPQPTRRLDVNGSARFRFTIHDANDDSGNDDQVLKSMGSMAPVWRNNDGRDWETGYSYRTGDVVNAQVEIDTFTNITFVAATSENENDGSSGTGGGTPDDGIIALDGLQEGDLVIAMGASDTNNFNSGQINNTTDGFSNSFNGTTLPLGLENNSAPDSFWAYKFVGVGETSASLNAGLTGGDGPAYAMFAFRGVDPDEPFGPDTSLAVDPEPVVVSTASDTVGSPNPPPITTTVRECMILLLGYLDDDSSAATVEPPNGYALAVAEDDGENDGSGATVMAAYAKLSEPGTVNPGAFTTTSDANKAISIALHPTQGTTLIRRLFRASGTFTTTGTSFPGAQAIGTDWEEISPGGDGSIIVPGADGGGTGDTEDKFKTIIADTGTTTADTVNDSLSILGGTGITTSITGDTLTITNTGGGGGGTGSQNVWATINSDSGSTTANVVSDTLTIAGGTDIGTSISGDTVTITYTGSAQGINVYAKYVGDSSANPNINGSTAYSNVTWFDPTPEFSASPSTAWVTDQGASPAPGDVATQVTIPLGGLYQISLDWYFTSTVIRANPGIRLAIDRQDGNGFVLEPETTASGYIRNNGGHNESSGTISAIYQLNAGDRVEVQSAQLAQSGTVSLQGAQSTLSFVRLV